MTDIHVHTSHTKQEIIAKLQELKGLHLTWRAQYDKCPDKETSDLAWVLGEDSAI